MLLRIEIENSELENIRKEYSGIITVEHILPRTPSAESNWRKLFNEDQRINWTNRLGNLVLLSGKKNSQAQNYEFDEKKRIYSGVKNTDFNITQQLSKIPVWTYDEMTNRHQVFKSALFKLYLN